MKKRAYVLFFVVFALFLVVLRFYGKELMFLPDKSERCTYPKSRTIYLNEVLRDFNNPQTRGELTLNEAGEVEYKGKVVIIPPYNAITKRNLNNESIKMRFIYTLASNPEIKNRCDVNRAAEHGDISCFFKKEQ